MKTHTHTHTHARTRVELQCSRMHSVYCPTSTQTACALPPVHRSAPFHAFGQMPPVFHARHTGTPQQSVSLGFPFQRYLLHVARC